MTSLQDFVMKIKPSLDAFLRNPTKDNLATVDEKLSKFTWSQLQIFHVQILLPLVLKLEKLNGHDQELQTGTINCISLVLSKLYLKEVQALQTILVIVLKQIRDCENAKTKQNLSEEIRLAAVECISMALQRSTTEVLEQYYTQESALFLGQVLLTLVEFIQYEKYKKLVTASLHCLMSIFYVHDINADFNDVVLRSQVADTLFIFLPKILTVLFKTCLSDEKQGETLLTTAVKTLSRIIEMIFEDKGDIVINSNINLDIFKTKIINDVNEKDDESQVKRDNKLFGVNLPREHLEEHLKEMQNNGRSEMWFDATSRKLKLVFRKLGESLRGHRSKHMRYEYAKMCCNLIQHCGNNLRGNFIYMLESVIAMSEDEEQHIAVLCQRTLEMLQGCKHNLFDESAELLFDEHLARLPRIIARCDDVEQYAELLFFKGFLRNLSATKLQTLFSLLHNLEMFCACLLAAADLKITRDLLTEEYTLRVMSEQEFQECTKLKWRKLKNLNSHRCVALLIDLCVVIGQMQNVNKIIFDYLMEMLVQQSPVMNEILLIMIWMIATQNQNLLDDQHDLVELLLNEILNDKHWHLELKADKMCRIEVDKPSDWFVDRTTGLYESAVEVRTKDFDSEDEIDSKTAKTFVSIADVEFNILHTCIVLDAVGHCATVLGEKFERYIFRCLHKVLLKVGSSISIIYQSANFALISMQRALKFSKTINFIESFTDFITYHLNRILRRNPESKSAVDILTVVLQYSSRNALPQLDIIFRTLRGECGKDYQSKNVLSYLKVFQAFLKNIGIWQAEVQHEVKDDILMQIDGYTETNLLNSWVYILQSLPTILLEETSTNEESKLSDQKIDAGSKNEAELVKNTGTKLDSKLELPQYINAALEIIEQVMKFVSSTKQGQQILALECLICGLPILRDYDDELLPLIHRLWQPLIERFRQNDPLVLNRCFTLLGIIAMHAKEFIAKKSLDDVIPFLKRFLTKTAHYSKIELNAARTQEYKLQVKLLQEFPSLIQHLVIEGKQLNEISNVVNLYLSENQPKELQQLSINYFRTLKFYNGPLIYFILLKKSHIKEYKSNIDIILKEFELNTD